MRSLFQHAPAGVAIAMLLITGCAIGPKYTVPSAPSAEAYKETPQGWKTAEPRDADPRGNWWEAFEDRQLNDLEKKLNISNQNIAAAVANLQASRAVIRQARAQYFPSASLNPAITNTRMSTVFGQASSINFTSYNLPLDASWEPDLWGRVRKTVQSNVFAAQASVADLENVRLSAQADLAADYFELRAQDSLQQVLDATVRADRESARLNRNLYAAGLANDEAVAQSESQLKAAEAQAASTGILRAQYEHAIAALAGEPASKFSLRPAPLNVEMPRIPPGVPSQLLERRPDIAAAERAVALANAQIGIARTAFFPAVTLSAAVGLESVSFANWLAWPARMWSVGPALAETVFDAGLRRATVAQYRASYDQAVANYRETVLTAFQQVEDNLAALRILRDTIAEQNSATEAAERSLREAEVRYQAGLDPYLNVIAAQTIVLNDRQTAVGFREQQMIAGVQLIKALGGGWIASEMPSGGELAGKSR
ncbi:MAG TPA: efflux transporter outer membrane subunit [Bryobacteraceae bacterium]|nr:efflux transporter outer membrane subunit [Bryobacteraceae bacterium]